MNENLEEVFLNKNYANVLTRKTIGGERSKICNRCEFAAAGEGNLSIHVKTHSGEKPNKCSQCNFSSPQAGGHI